MPCPQSGMSAGQPSKLSPLPKEIHPGGRPLLPTSWCSCFGSGCPLREEAPTNVKGNAFFVHMQSKWERLQFGGTPAFHNLGVGALLFQYPLLVAQFGGQQKCPGYRVHAGPYSFNPLTLGNFEHENSTSHTPPKARTPLRDCIQTCSFGFPFNTGQGVKYLENVPERSL